MVYRENQIIKVRRETIKPILSVIVETIVLERSAPKCIDINLP